MAQGGGGYRNVRIGFQAALRSYSSSRVAVDPVANLRIRPPIENESARGAGSLGVVLTDMEVAAAQPALSEANGVFCAAGVYANSKSFAQ